MINRKHLNFCVCEHQGTRIIIIVTNKNKVMGKMSKQSRKIESVKSLQSLRNIGPATAERLYSIGIKTPQQIKESDPEKLFKKLKAKEKKKLDRCVLYQLQGAKLDIPWPLCKDFTIYGKAS